MSSAPESGHGTLPPAAPAVVGDRKNGKLLRSLLTVAVVALAALASVPATPAAAAPAQGEAAAVLAAMPLEQQVGQVFMVGGPATGVGPDTVSAVRDRHVGSVILTGRSSRGVAGTAQVSAGLQALATPAATAGVGLLIAADQEGGAVQVLQGPGFSAIASALTQGNRAPAALRGDAATWGGQLRAAGVNVNLAPVLDTVPSPAAAANNPPIGGYDREFGYTPATVASHGTAFAQGMADAGVAATAKHFPGLGRVPGNTDTTAGVTDRVTTRNDPYLAPFAAAVQAGIPMLMMSTAYYSLIDPAHPAAFSSTIINGMVRDDLGFQGVVISDDLGSAQQVAAWAPGDRALQFLAAGGDLVLTVDPAQLPAMYDAVLSRARTDATLRARVQQAALRVLQLKQARGLLPALGSQYFLGDSLGGTADRVFIYGDPADQTYFADWDGNGTDTPAVLRGNTFYARNSNSSGRADLQFSYGDPGDTVLVGDWDGNGTDTPAVLRGNTFYARNSNSSGRADLQFSYGDAGDTVFVGDWDGNGTDTPAVLRGNTFYARNSNSSGGADLQFSYGDPGDTVVVGDWDGNGTDTPAVRRGNTFYARNSNTTGRADLQFSYGDPGDIVLVGDWDGNGTDSLGVRRPIG